MFQRALNPLPGSGGSGTHTFSYTEQKTNMIWVDGSPIYELTVRLDSFQAPANVSTHVLLSDVSFIKELIDACGSVVVGTGAQEAKVPVDVMAMDNSWGNRIYILSNQLKLEYKNSISQTLSGNIIIYYTKN